MKVHNKYKTITHVRIQQMLRPTYNGPMTFMLERVVEGSSQKQPCILATAKACTHGSAYAIDLVNHELVILSPDIVVTPIEAEVTIFKVG